MKEILEKALLKKIERLEAFEERMNIRLENISIRITNHNWLNFFCEIHPVSGTKINEDTIIECVIYDKEGAIIKMKSHCLYEDDFFGFEVLEFTFTDNELADKIGKIRIYPKK